jgi:hypothetical protein
MSNNPSREATPIAAAKPILRPIHPDEASRFSPWPERIRGTKPWTKTKRSAAEINREYDQQLYAPFLALWEDFYRRLAPKHRHAGAAARFFIEATRQAAGTLSRNTASYGDIDPQAYLVSAADRLYVADCALFIEWATAYVFDRVAKLQHEWPFDSLVEIGCGYGRNLFPLYVRLDLAPSAILLQQRIAAALGVTGRFVVGDYGDIRVLESLATASGRWALMSVHAIEQAEALDPSWLERVLRLDNPPCVGIHFEPLQWGDESPFAAACAKYAEINRYDAALLAMLHRAEAAGLVEIVQQEKRVIGVSAYNPTSLVVWTPLNSRE